MTSAVHRHKSKGGIRMFTHVEFCHKPRCLIIRLPRFPHGARVATQTPNPILRAFRGTNGIVVARKNEYFQAVLTPDAPIDQILIQRDDGRIDVVFAVVDSATRAPLVRGPIEDMQSCAYLVVIEIVFQVDLRAGFVSFLRGKIRRASSIQESILLSRRCVPFGGIVE